jgi:dsRNA-specific ribonuclease
MVEFGSRDKVPEDIKPGTGNSLLRSLYQQTKLLENNGYTFSSESEYLFTMAFTHKSFKDDEMFRTDPVFADQKLKDALNHFNYEKLELLGDSIVNLCILK